MSGYLLIVWILVNGNMINQNNFGPYYNKAECEAAWSNSIPDLTPFRIGTTTAAVTHMCVKTQVIG